MKTTAITWLMLFMITVSANASDNTRIDQLEKAIEALQLRVSRMESFPRIGDTGEAQTGLGDGWKSIANWRKLNTGMDQADARVILGEPEHIDGGDLTRWLYPNDGEVTFLHAKVFRWHEPQRK